MNANEIFFEFSAGEPQQFPASDIPEIAVCGRSNVGKSSLINAVFGRHALARTGARPGKTATVNFYRTRFFRLCDLPGYGYAKVSFAERQRYSRLIDGYFSDERDCRLVIQLLDMRIPPSTDDQKMLDFLIDDGIPFIVALTKADKLKATERRHAENRWQETFSELSGLRVIPFSAVTKEGTEQICDCVREVSED